MKGKAMTPRFQPMDFCYIGSRRLLIIEIGKGTIFPLTDTLCYYTYDYTEKKSRVFAVAGIDQRASKCSEIRACVPAKNVTP